MPDDAVVVAHSLPGDAVPVPEGGLARCGRRCRPRTAGADWPVRAVRARRAPQHIESSTEIHCGPLAWMSFSVRPRVGRISAVSPQTRCERFSLVETCTVSPALRIASLGDVGVGDGLRRSCRRGRGRRGPRRPAARGSSRRCRSPCSRGGSKPNSFCSASRKCSAAAPRCPSCGRPARWSGRGPGTARRRACRCCPGASATLAISLMVATALRCWVSPIAQQKTVRVGVARAFARPRSICARVKPGGLRRPGPSRAALTCAAHSSKPVVYLVDEVVVEGVPLARSSEPIAWNSARSPLSRIGRCRSASSVPLPTTPRGPAGS